MAATVRTKRPVRIAMVMNRTASPCLLQGLVELIGRDRSRCRRMPLLQSGRGLGRRKKVPTLPLSPEPR